MAGNISIWKWNEWNAPTNFSVNGTWRPKKLCNVANNDEEKYLEKHAGGYRWMLQKNVSLIFFKSILWFIKLFVFTKEDNAKVNYD